MDISEHTDKDGSWLVFAREFRALTAFSPHSSDGFKDIVLGWPGKTDEHWYVETLKTVIESFAPFDQSVNCWRLNLSSYGKEKIVAEKDCLSLFSVSNELESMIKQQQTNQDSESPSYLSVDLSGSEINSMERIELNLWGRTDVSVNEAITVPNGTVGAAAKLPIIDLLGNHISEAIVSTNVTELDFASTKEMLRTIVAYFNKTQGDYA